MFRFLTVHQHEYFVRVFLKGREGCRHSRESGNLNRTTEDLYTSSHVVSFIPPAMNHWATSQRPMNGAQAGFIRRSSVARPFMAGNVECTNVVWIDLGGISISSCLKILDARLRGHDGIEPIKILRTED